MKKKQNKGFFPLQKVLGRLLYLVLITLLFAEVSIHAATDSSILHQSYTLNLEFKNEKIELILDEISRQSGIHIAYSNAQIPINTVKSVNLKTTNIEEALTVVLGKEYSYKLVGNNIVIARKTAPDKKTEVKTDQTQKRKVSGLITDSDGNPITGATVSVKSTTNGVISDINGMYEIQAQEGDILEYRYIGYNTEEKVLKKESTLNIRMQVVSVGLEDVVVIGYGQQKKSSVVASINAISSKELSIPTRSLTNNIAGQIAGVIAIQRSGEPGRDDSQFWIRGISSFAGGTDPLVLVDGVPRKMNDIGVDEIESFTVLKDAAATAVYGAEGANGVVLVTSKRGLIQKTQLDVRAEYSIAKPTRLPKLLGSYDYLSLYNDAVWYENGNPTSGFVKPYSDDVLEKYRTGSDPDIYPNSNFMDLLGDQTHNERVTLNLRGGTEKVRYFVSGGFYKENGIFESNAIDKYNANIGLERYNLRSNIDIDITKTTTLSTDISGQYINSSGPGASTEKIFSNIVYFAPYLFPLQFSDGKFADDKMANTDNSNPYNLLNESGYTKYWSAYLQSKVSLNQKLDFITKGLSVKLNVSFDADYASSVTRSKTPTVYYTTGRNDQGEIQYTKIKEGTPNLSDPIDTGRSGEKKIYLEGSFNYNRVFAEKHDVSGLLLYMQKETQAQGSGLPYKKQSAVARATYGYDNRYLAETSFGITGSENFAKGNRYGIFPAAGVAWYVSNESFMRNLDKVIYKLKLRLSYGVTGNDAVGGSRFPYRGNLNMGAPGIDLGFTGGVGGGGTNTIPYGITEGTFSAPFLSWEIEKKKNAGIDLGIWGGRIDMTFDVFQNDRSQILMLRKTVSSATGFRQTPWQNFGKVSNKGFDGTLVAKEKIGDLMISLRGNITYAHNKIIEYDEAIPKFAYQQYTGNSLNKPLLFMDDGLYKYDDFNVTVDPSTGAKSFALKEGLPVPNALVKPGDIKHKDLNKDGKIDSYDQTYDHNYYSPTPEWVYGFGLNLEYKGFYAGIFFQGVANASISLNKNRFTPFELGPLGSIRKESTNHWKDSDPDNQDVLFPRLHPTLFTNNQYWNSSWWYRSANFLRLKNVEFGYQFRTKALAKTPLKNARLYVQGNNLAVWDNIKMWDPELGDNASGAVYPISKTWTVGLELTF